MKKTSYPICVILLSAVLALPIELLAQGVAINPVEEARDVVVSTVMGMTQDRQGFLWLATRGDGLLRYDGKRFVTYRHDADANSLTFDTVENIAIDSSGFIWLALFYHGLDRLDPTTGVFT